MLINIFDFINDTGYDVALTKGKTEDENGPTGESCYTIIMRDPETKQKVHTYLSDDALRKVTDRRYFQSRILGVMADQLKIASDRAKREEEERRKAAERREQMREFWKGPVFIDGSRSEQ